MNRNVPHERFGGLLHLRCPLHPTYRGIQRPRVECNGCKLLYNLMQGSDR